MVWHFISVIILLCCLAQHAQAHGLMVSKGKTQLYGRNDNIMVKIELVPNDVQFNQENNLQISVIDISESGVFNNKVDLEISHLDADNNSKSIFSGEYQTGLFKQPVAFQKGGTHELELILDTGQPDKKKIFKFKFELKDNRHFARTTALTAILSFAIFACIIGFTIKSRTPFGGNKIS